MKRRTFLGMPLSAAAMTMMGVPLVARSDTKKFKGVTLRINGYGGDNTRIFKERVADKLKEETGLNVVYQDGTVAAATAKLIATKNNPAYDILMADSPNIPDLVKQDIIEPVTADDIPNLSKALPITREFGDYGAPIIANAVVFAYNSKFVNEPINAYEDLLRDDLKNRLGMLSPENTGGLLTLLGMAKAAGGSLDNLDPAFELLEDLKSNLSTVTSSTVTLLQLYEQEEVWAGPYWDGRIHSMREKGLPIEIVSPQEGVYALFNYLSPVKGSKNREAALAYINEAMSDQAVSGLVDFFGYAPGTDLKVSEERAKDLVGYGDRQKDVQSVDWKKVGELRGEILKRFNSIVG